MEQDEWLCYRQKHDDSGHNLKLKVYFAFVFAFAAFGVENEA